MGDLHRRQRARRSSSHPSALGEFPDTGNPGYFIIKFALWLLAGVHARRHRLDLTRPRWRRMSADGWPGLALLLLVGVTLVAHRPARLRHPDPCRRDRRGRRRSLTGTVAVRAAVRPAGPAPQPARERPAAGAAALCADGPAARPPAGCRRRCFAPASALLPRGRRRRWSPALGLGALLGPMNGSVGASVLACRAWSRRASPRAGVPAPTRARDHRGRQHARRGDPALAGADPARRRDALGAHLRGQRHRARRPRHQYAGRLPRRAGAGRAVSGAVPVVGWLVGQSQPGCRRGRAG